MFLPGGNHAHTIEKRIHPKRCIQHNSGAALSVINPKLRANPLGLPSDANMAGARPHFQGLSGTIKELAAAGFRLSNCARRWVLRFWLRGLSKFKGASFEQFSAMQA